MSADAMIDSYRIVPANLAPWQDLSELLGTCAAASRCQCQRYKLGRGESFARLGDEELAHRLRTQTETEHPDAPATTGLLAYSGARPVGWCAVEARTAYAGLLRVAKVPWEGRSQDKADDGVWAVTCFVTRAGFRRRGVATALARAAVGHARRAGARAIEAYPITTTAAISEELHVGLVGMFENAGFRQVSAPTSRRVVMRLDFAEE
ncbi:MAG TPA: GNAT family N-acetyltransferase [Ruania sp.]|nr:GNAT family N-acetyltransferase [Ruania sp.]